MTGAPAPTRRGCRRWPPSWSIVGVIGVTLWQLHLICSSPNTTTTGGRHRGPLHDAGLLSSNAPAGLHLTGWDPGWYDGYPIYTFYFVLPDVLVALGSHLIPYTWPSSWPPCWARCSCRWPPGPAVGCSGCGRPARPPWPRPPCRSSSTTRSPSTAGTCSPPWPASTPTRSRGPGPLVPRPVRPRHAHRPPPGLGGGRCWRCASSAHIVPAMFAIAGAALLTLSSSSRRRWRLHDDGFGPSSAVAPAAGREGVLGRRHAVWWAVSTVGLGRLLSGWWLVPFGIDQPYSTPWATQNVTTYATLLFPRADLWASGPGRGGGRGGASPCGAASASCSRSWVASRPPSLIVDPLGQPLQRAVPAPVVPLRLPAGRLAVRRWWPVAAGPRGGDRWALSVRPVGLEPSAQLGRGPPARAGPARPAGPRRGGRPARWPWPGCCWWWSRPSSVPANALPASASPRAPTR